MSSGEAGETAAPPSLPEFALISDIVRLTAVEAPERIALIEGGRSLPYREFDADIDRVAAALQRDGVKPRETIAICAAASIEYVVAFLGALRAAVVAAPLGAGSPPAGLAAMARDCAARLLFPDATTESALSEVGAPRVALD